MNGRKAMSNARSFWLPFVLVVVCLATFAFSYTVIADNARWHTSEARALGCLVGSPLFIGVTATAVLFAALKSEEKKNKRFVFALCGGSGLALFYAWALMATIAGTLSP